MQLEGRNVLVTGAAGGIGAGIVKRLVERGANLVLSGRNESALEKLRATIGGRAEIVTADLSDRAQVEPLVEGATRALGPIDVLVNNAGVEFGSAFTKARPEELEATVHVNLLAPMLLTRRLLPEMLERGRGHVLNIASLAGKFPPPYNGAYGATKAGLISFTQSLRVEYRGAPVGFSVVCPGFVSGDGMYARVEEMGVKANLVTGTVPVDKVAKAAVRAIERDRAEVIVNGAPVRPVITLSSIFPKFPERVAGPFGVTKIFREMARVRERV